MRWDAIGSMGKETSCADESQTYKRLEWQGYSGAGGLIIANIMH